ncbi:MAG: HAD family hydrolase [Planctomycetes bacterium]|nr:HAD family hydrolase [Planctomycetota bacterium]
MLTAVYKKLFLPNRQIRFIGVDLDDCLYDVTPIRHRLVQKIHTALKPSPLSLRAEGKAISWALYSAYKDDLEAEAIKKQKAKASLESRVTSLESGLRTPDPRLIDSYIERTYRAYKDFSRLDNPDIRALYKPYKGVKGTLRDLVGSGFIVGILTNGPSRFQKDKIGLLGLKEGKHFNFVTVSEETGIGKPSRRFFKLARERASQFVVRRSPLVARKAGDESRVTSDECLILEDQVKNISGADGWLKVQFLRGYHSNIQPENVHEIPKYGITSFSLIPDLIKLEKDSDFQAVSGSYFILKSLLLIAYNLCYESPLLSI